MQFPETELIITDKNNVYHLDINEEHIADDVILVGDQGRVEQISNMFSKVECKIQHREFVTHLTVSVSVLYLPALVLIILILL
jgi:uridine phosphorylase